MAAHPSIPGDPTQPHPDELARARDWAAARFAAPPHPGPMGQTVRPAPPFSFVYDGRPAAALLGGWGPQTTCRRLDEDRDEYTVTWRDPASGLVVACVAVVWQAWPIVEWTLHLRHEGTGPSGLIERLQGLDWLWEGAADADCVLHHHRGDDCTLHSFAPLQTPLGRAAAVRLGAARGRPTSEGWPYFNLERKREDAGVVVAVGWPGQWAASFTGHESGDLHLTAGQEHTRFRLQPGERARTPLIVLQFYRGTPVRAQNIWRRWMLAHNLPQDHGRALGPRMGAASVQYCGFVSTQAGDLEFIEAFRARGLRLDYWWMDAGWYQTDGEGWPKVGTWEVDGNRFPGGLRAIADHCHAAGTELIVWFEVERVHAGSWLAQHHPEWIHGGAAGGLFRMDDPAAVAWVTERVDQLITDHGIDLYRSDFNIDPLDYWRAADAPDRQGLTEMRYIEGYLRYWDELRRRHPGMLIDACASGGRRNDLESMRRAVPLLRSDFEAHPEGNQCHTYGFAAWIPYYNAVHNWDPSPYRFHSCMAPFVQRNWDVRQPGFDAALAQQFIAQWEAAAPGYRGDFYPLTGYGADDTIWMAWQFHRANEDEGLVQAFRRARSPFVTARFTLQGLALDGHYALTETASGRCWTAPGAMLCDQGLEVTIAACPGAALICYRRVDP